MLLAIDVGNTNTVLGCYWGGKLKRTWRVSTHPLCTGDEFRAKVFQLFSIEKIESHAFNSVVVSSVVPQMTKILRDAFPTVRFLEIDHTWPFSFEISANPKDQVGMDRLVNAEAAVREYGANGTPLIILDSGTATTLCAISKNLEYLGGAIMPGVELSMKMLTERTAKLFAVQLKAPANSIGTNTSEALQSGLLLGYASMIDGMIQRFKKELPGREPKVIATGGVSELLEGVSSEIHVVDPNLTLKGISYLYDEFVRRQ